MDFLFPSMAYAAGADQGTPSLIASIFPLLIIFVIFYFLLIRPEQKKKKEHQSMVDTLAVGNSIVTKGGIIGTIEKVEEECLTIKVAGATKLKIIRSAVSSLKSENKPTKTKEEDK